MPGVIGRLEKPYGKGTFKVGIWTIAVTGTATVSTGFEHIENAQVTVIDSNSTLPTSTASITAISGQSVNIVVTEHQAAANIVSETEHTVDLLVVGFQHDESAPN